MASTIKGKSIKTSHGCVNYILLFVVAFAFGFVSNSNFWVSISRPQYEDLTLSPPSSIAFAEELATALPVSTDAPPTDTKISIDQDTENNYETSSFFFENTMRSCLGDYCFNERPDKSPVDRVGILGPPGSGALTVTNMVQRFVEKDKKKNVEVVYSTNVPPYGYGKNHGWNRIIRLVRKVLPHASSLLVHAHADELAISPVQYELQVRQLVRWHCRLSHVAAHTRMLTVFTDDLVLRPLVELQRMVYLLRETSMTYLISS